MLDPKALAALSDALDQVISQIGDDPKLKDLADALSAARDAAASPDTAAEEDPNAEADPNAPKDDPYSFDQAQSKLTDSRSAAGAQA